MKRKCLLLFAILMMVGIVGCGRASKVKIAMVFSKPGDFTEENNFLMSAWQGIQRYGEENDTSVAYYIPEHNYEEAQEKVVKKAVNDGAEVIVFPEYLLEKTAFWAQEQYPELHIIILEGIPNNGEEENYQEKIGDYTCAVEYDEWQAGFLAGYAAVMDGFTNLGFFGGMQLPPVIRFGYGYVQGAEYAAQEMQLEQGAIEMKYFYTGTFVPSVECQTRAAQWYWEGTEVIFACGGAMGQSVVQASNNSEGDVWVIGVDTDQSGDSEHVLTSSIKSVSASVYEILRLHYEEKCPSGSMTYHGVAEESVGLTMETSRFREFNQEQYDEIYNRLRDKAFEDSAKKKVDDAKIEELPLWCVTLEYEK